MSARLRRNSFAEAQRNVQRGQYGFGGGAWEELPLREIGAMNSDGITGLAECHNFIPNQRNLRSRTSPQMLLGTVPTDTIAVSWDNPEFGILVTASRKAYRTDAVLGWTLIADMSYTESVLPLAVTQIQVSAWADGYLVEFEAIGAEPGQRNYIYQDASLAWQIERFYCADSYLKQMPKPESGYGTIDSTTENPNTSAKLYCYDYCFTFVVPKPGMALGKGVSVDAIMHESGTLDGSFIDYVRGSSGQFHNTLTQDALRVNYTDPINEGHLAKFNLANWISPSTGAIQPSSGSNSVSAPMGYSAIAIYRTMQKNPSVTLDGAGAASRGGFANQDFRLVGVYALNNAIIDVTVTDEALAGRPVLSTRNYLCTKPTGKSCLGTGFYMAYDDDSRQVRYTDTGTHPGNIGFYLPGYQQIELEQPMNAMVASKQSIIAAGSSMTWQFHLDSAQHVKSSVPGRALFQITSWRTDKTRGIKPSDALSLECTEDGSVWAVCSDGTLRYHMGDVWSEDVAFGKINRKLTIAKSTILQSDPQGLILVHLEQADGTWLTYRVQGKGNQAGAFCSFGGADWRWKKAIRTRWIGGGHSWLSASGFYAGAGGLPMMDGVRLYLYCESLAMDSYACTSPVWFKTGVFTGEKMSHFTQHLESHVFTEAIPGVASLPTAFHAEIEAWGSGVDSLANDNRAEAMQQAMDFQDGEDIVFPKWLGEYRGYALKVEWDKGGFQVLQLDTAMKVFDRPARAELASPKDVESLVGQAKMRWGQMHRYGFEAVNQLTQLPTARAQGPLDEPNMPMQAGYVASALTIGKNIGPIASGMVFGTWLRFGSNTASQIALPTASGQWTIAISRLTGVSGKSTRIAISHGAQSYNFDLEADVRDGLWHHLAIGIQPSGLAGVCVDDEPCGTQTFASTAMPNGLVVLGQNDWFDAMILPLPNPAVITEEAVGQYIYRNSRELNNG